MTEQAYQERSSSRSGYRGRDASPDSVIFTLESNFSLFSSASASVDRCSFASDAHDRDSLASEISLHLAGSRGGGGEGNELHEASSGPDRDRDPDPDPNPNKLVAIHSSNTKHHAHAHSRLFRKVEKAKVQKEEDNNKALAASLELLEDDSSSHLIDSARNSFSLALKECQERRSRSEAVCKKADRRRPASLDLNNVIAAAASPRLSGMKKNTISSSSRKSAGTFPSPGTPNYRVAMQKGWSSERVPLHHNHSNNRRQQVNANASLLLPFNNNGRTLPSKWEDAERWIFSPVSGDGGMRTSIHQVPQRRPKSKSGPLGPPGIAYYSLYSPAMPVFDGGNMGNFMAASSPFSAAVINSADGLSIRSNGNGVRTEPCMARSVSVHGCSEVLPHSSFSSQDEKLDDVKDAAATDLSSVSRRDMATQMSPEGSCNHSSSPSMRRPSLSIATPSILPIVEVQNVHSSKSSQVVRDVQVDERVTVTRWSKKHRSRNQGKKTSDIVDDWRKKSVDATRASSPWDVSEAAKSISKVKRDEAKITAWENLQKAEAEAAIRKLEMKLEKKRSSSMDKIMNKLRSAQKRAQEMRSSVLANQAHQVSRTPHKAISFRRTRQMGSLSGCFTCHAF